MSTTERQMTEISVAAFQERPPSDLAKFEDIELAQELLRRVFTNVDMKEPSLLETPHRLLKFWKEFNQKCDLEDIQKLLHRNFDNRKGSKSMVVQVGVPVAALCEHHLLPFFGVANIGYLPKDNVVGLSKLARLVKAIGSRRPTVQETLTREIARLLYTELGSLGSIVTVQAEHTCMTIRGVKAPGVITTTCAIEGLFRDASQSRQEFFELVKLQGGRS